MNNSSYFSVHNHTDYSNLRLIDSINSVEKLIDRAYKLGLNGVAITDHESVSGHIKALQYYNKKYKDKKDSFKLVLGNEIYVSREGLNELNHEKGEKFYHFILLAKDEIGHKQIRELSSIAWSRSYMKNMMRVPTYPSDLKRVIGENKGHIVATTACLGGFAAASYFDRNIEVLNNFLSEMNELFGDGNFFIELQPYLINSSFDMFDEAQPDQVKYNIFMIQNYWGIYPFIYTTDSHYLSKEDRKIHKLFLQSKSGEREVDSFYYYSYMMDYNEIVSFFSSYISKSKIDEMTKNTNEILNMIKSYDLNHIQIVPRIKYDSERFDLNKIKIIYKLFVENMNETHKYLQFYLNTDIESASYLVHLIMEGYYNKIYTFSSSVTIKERLDRLNYELEQIYEISMQMEESLSDYFITMAKMIEIIWNDGDSLVGPGRGSASGFLINYLIGITQIDPQTQMLYLPPWRFIHKDRGGLPDIDIDTESTKRLKVFNKLQQYFNSINSNLINVCTFGTEGSKSAIRTASRSLDIDDAIVAYLTSMIPNERGFDLTLSQCYYGDEDHKPIKAFVDEMNNNKDLWLLASSIEGLITRLGVHASGVLVVDQDPTSYNSIMKTSKGILVSAYNLEDSEYMGGLKYDLLTVQALDKIHATLNYLLEDNKIEWQGNLRSTYDKYLLPVNLNYDNRDMWEKLWNGDIPDVFQFDTMVGGQAIKMIKPQNVGELAVANSIMRLMAQEELELPLDTYVKYKNNLDLWYNEMMLYGLNRTEVEVLEPYLKPLYGVADSQESVMMLTMDPKITNFTLNEANSLRKAIAKKDSRILEKTKEMFYIKGRDLGTSDFLLNYVWNLQIGRQVGYSFSILHTMAYSIIALQEMNLAYYYPDIYWKTACLSVNAGAINEEDYYNLVEEGIIELSDDDDKRSQTKIQYGKVASAISKMSSTINIRLPDINLSKMGFSPNLETNSVLYGIKGITRIGDNIIQEILLNRPYESLKDFLVKLNGKGKTIISKDKVINLIKAGAFDVLENKSREEILADFIGIIADQKQKLTLSNFLMLIKNNLVPEKLEEEKKCYIFTKYIRKSKINGEYYQLDDIAMEYFLERFPSSKLINEKYIKISWWDSLYNVAMDKVRTWIKSNESTLLSSLNNELYQVEFNKYAWGDKLTWELQALNFFYSGHPLTNVKLPIETTPLNEIKEGEVIGQFQIKGKIIPKLKIHSIMGTVIDKEKVKSIVTLSTLDGVIDIKFYKQEFSKYIHESENEDEDIHNEENFFEKGTHLLITGIKRGELFVPKVYKQMNIPPVLKIVLNKNGGFDSFKSK